MSTLLEMTSSAAEQPHADGAGGPLVSIRQGHLASGAIQAARRWRVILDTVICVDSTIPHPIARRLSCPPCGDGHDRLRPRRVGHLAAVIVAQRGLDDNHGASPAKGITIAKKCLKADDTSARAC
jgi:hypothetical protein